MTALNHRLPARRVELGMLGMIAYLSLGSSSALATAVPAMVDTCFTPAERCVGKVVTAIAGARHEILLQSYYFTSAAIGGALSDARRRGVRLFAILDATQESNSYSGATFLAHAGIEVRIDDQVAIQHNKLLVVDASLVIGGSYNHTEAAERRNAENLVFLQGRELAARYTANFYSRWNVARPLSTTR